HRAASEAGLGGPLLDRSVQAALQAARKVRGQTPLAERPVTLAAAALRVARDLHGDLGRCSALILGLGEMGEILAAELRNAGVGDLAVCHPQELRARTAAHRLRCHRRSWEEREAALVAADIVVAASGSGRYAIDRELAARVLKRRRRKPLFLVDAALPRDVEPGVEEVDGVFLYDLDDLERLAQAGRSHRESASGAAWRLLEQELRQFRREQAEREGLDALLALRRHGEALRREALAERGGDAAAATRLLLNRLLHDPSEVLRAAAAGDAGERRKLEKALARLFRLAPAKGDDS
ncbi:MAG: glutamyl-tRNA reductase, partial [Tistlia sp.]